MDPEPALAYCGHCGQPASQGNQPDQDNQADHANQHDYEACHRASALDPPRFCTRCGRRMVVKVTPDRWTARCSRHGSSHSQAALDSAATEDLSR